MRATFDVLEEQIPIARTEIASGTQVFDWVVPDEWNIRDAYIATADGTRVVDFSSVQSARGLLQRAGPDDALARAAARATAHPPGSARTLIPYRTSYYDRTWGFCLPHRQLLELPPGDYEVVIDSTLEPGHLSYAELVIEGESEGEVLVSTYVCHPSLANDNLSGIAVATMLARALLRARPAPHVSLPVRSRHDRAARLAVPEPRPARPGRARA